MLRSYFYPSFLYLILGGLCLSWSSGYNNSSEFQGIKPGVSDESSDNRSNKPKPLSRREKIALLDPRDQDIHKRAYRRGDWSRKGNWPYNRKAFYRGETQAKAYREEYPYGRSGIGYDKDHTRQVASKDDQITQQLNSQRNRKKEKSDSDQKKQNQLNPTQQNSVNRPNQFYQVVGDPNFW